MNDVEMLRRAQQAVNEIPAADIKALVTARINADVPYKNMAKKLQKAEAKRDIRLQKQLRASMKSRRIQLEYEALKELARRTAEEQGHEMVKQNDAAMKQFDLYAGQLMIAIEILDSILCDFEKMFDNCDMFHSVRSFSNMRALRSEIAKWQDTYKNNRGEAMISLFQDEADRCYDYIVKRSEVTERKALRLMNKQEKEAKK